MHGCHPSIRSIKVVFACFRRNHFDPAPSISSEERQNIRSRAGSLRDKTSAATTRLLHLSLFNWCIYVALCIDPQLVVSIRQKACPATQVWVSACTLGGKLAPHHRGARADHHHPERRGAGGAGGRSLLRCVPGDNGSA